MEDWGSSGKHGGQGPDGGLEQQVKEEMRRGLRPEEREPAERERELMVFADWVAQ